MSTEPKHHDHRRAARRRIKVDIEWDAGIGTTGGWIRDISSTGMFIETEDLLPLGTWVLLDFDLPGKLGGHVRAAGKVARSCDPIRARETGLLAGVGIEFREIKAAHRTVLERFLGGSI